MKSVIAVGIGLLLALAVGVVESVDEAIAHVNAHGSRHSEAIVTASERNRSTTWGWLANSGRRTLMATSRPTEIWVAR